MTTKRNKCFILIMLILLANMSFALKSDESKPLMIQAKQADFDKEKGISTYRGNVTISQGSSRATGDVGIAYFDNDNQIKEAVITGKPAHYWTIPEPAKPELHVFGEKIDLFPEKNIVIVTGHARVEQNHDHLTGDRIVYNLKTHETHAYSNTKQPTSMTLIQKK